MSLEARIVAALQAIGVDIKGLVVALAERLQHAHVGSAPNEVPSGQHLGSLAYLDTVGLIDAFQHEPDSRANQLWWRRVSDSDLRMTYRGLDGVVREISITGPQGPKGDKGDIGPQGQQGPKGDTGPQGPKGDTGATGATGPQGLQGPKGDKGDSGVAGATGAQGPQGPKGDAGLTGAQGAKGDKGEKGDAGPQGPKGDTGVFDYLTVGPAPNQVPSNQHLGALAFIDTLGATQVTQHTRDSQPGDVWHERISDTQLIKKYHGLDGVVRSITETYA